MGDAIRNRLQKYAWRTPGSSKSTIIAEMVLTLSWTMLFEIVCENMNNPLKDHSNLELLLRRRMADIGPLAPKRPHNPRTTPAQPPAQPPWEAGWGIWSSAPAIFQDPLAYWQHRWTRQHHWKSWSRRGDYAVMDNAI